MALASSGLALAFLALYGARFFWSGLGPLYVSLGLPLPLHKAAGKTSCVNLRKVYVHFLSLSIEHSAIVTGVDIMNI